MEKSPNDDLLVSHRVLNYLFAGFQGEFCYSNFMREMRSPEVTDEVMDRLNLTLKQIFGWYQGLGKGDCILSASWTAPQTFESRRALDWLDSLRSPLIKAAEHIQTVIKNANQVQLTRESSRRAIAHFARFAASNHSYSKGLLDLASLLKQEPDPGLRIMFNQSLEDMGKAKAYADSFQSAGLLADDLMPKFLVDIKRVPGTLLAQIHDITLLLSPYKGGETYLKSFFTQSEIAEWYQNGISLVDAGYWRAFEFNSEQAKQWIDSGIPIPGIASAWRTERFSGTEASEWAANGLTPIISRKWIAAGFKCAEALSYIKRGFADPDELPKGD